MITFVKIFSIEYLKNVLFVMLWILIIVKPGEKMFHILYRNFFDKR